MKLKNTLTASAFLMLILLQSCSPEGDEPKNGESHNMGENCMNCHKPGGGEAPVWNIAGTVYDEALTATNSNATIQFFSGPDGTGDLKYTFKVDGQGNFYSPQVIDYSTDIYVAVVGATSTRYMPNPVTTGACNSCHNVDKPRIWAR